MLRGISLSSIASTSSGFISVVSSRVNTCGWKYEWMSQSYKRSCAQPFRKRSCAHQLWPHSQLELTLYILLHVMVGAQPAQLRAANVARTPEESLRPYKRNIYDSALAVHSWAGCVPTITCRSIYICIYIYIYIFLLYGLRDSPGVLAALAARSRDACAQLHFRQRSSGDCDSYWSLFNSWWCL